MSFDPVSFVNDAVANDSNVARPFAEALEELAGNRQPNPAILRAEAAITESARKRDLAFVKERARAYLAHPKQLDALDPVLRLCSPDEALALLNEMKPRHYVEAVNRRGAMSAFRYLRRRERGDAFAWEVTDAGVEALLSDPVGVCPFTGDALVNIGGA